MSGVHQADAGGELSRRVVARLRASKRKHTLVEQLVARLDTPREILDQAIDGLVARGEVVRTRKGRVALAARLGLVRGIVRAGRRGRAVVVPDPPDEPISLSRGAIRPAMNGDLVLVEVEPYTRRGLRNGKVRAVLERHTRSLVGTVRDAAKGTTVLAPLDPRVGYVATFAADSPVPQADVVVEAEIIDYPTSLRDPVVRLSRTLGPAGTLATEIVAVCSSLGIETDFDCQVEQEAASFAEPSSIELNRREDLRAIPCVTIDPADARDFDDAVAIERCGNGFRLTVSIADVAHYVRPGTALDVAAYERGTSVYFPGRCIPMLPERLSGDLASLKPGVERLALSVCLDIDATGEVLRTRFARSVIRSRHRFTYEQVEKILGGAAIAATETTVMLSAMAECAGHLLNRRMRRGAIDLDLPESEFDIDDAGEPRAVRRKPRLQAHRLVEEFMIAANEAVARELENHDSEDEPLAFLYRIHLKPPAEAVEAMAAKLLPLGYRLQVAADGIRPAAIQALLARAAGRDEERLVNLLILRSLQQACYSEHKAGHFGLASASYTHFTSPIRRYPDLVVHRAVCALLDERTGTLPTRAGLADVALHCSARERRAMDAERDVTRAAAVLLMQPHIGREFTGTVTNVVRYGYYVELDELFVEGFVPVARLRDYYTYLPDRMELHARETRDVVVVGRRLRVRLVGADLAERTLDLVPVEKR